MQYNMYFDVYAIIIILFEIVYLLLRKNRKDAGNRFFLALLVVSVLTAVTDIVSAEMIMNATYYRIESIYIWNTTYFFLHQSIAFLMVQYVVLLIGHSETMRRSEKAVVMLPFTLVFLALLTNPLTHWIFSLDEKGIYHREVLFFLLYLNVFYYLALGIFYTIRYRNRITGKVFVFLIIFVALGGFPVVLQMMFPNLLIELFFQSIGMLLVLLVIDNDDELLNVILHSEKEKKKKIPWLFAPTPVNLMLILLGVIVNLIGRFFAGSYTLPFWLDTVGTLIVAIQLGPVAGAFTGLMFNAILGLVNPDSFWYLFVNAGVGFAVGFFYPRRKERDTFLVAATSVIAGVVAVFLSTPINLIFFDGYTANVWGDGLYDMLSKDIHVPLICSILGEAFVDIPDKALSMLLAIGIITSAEKIGSRPKTKNAAFFLPLLLPVLLFLSQPVTARADDTGAMPGAANEVPDYANGYEAVIYDTTDGLVTAEINVITQTKDGYIWAGSYSGLYRYDGVRFEEMAPDAKINNVMALYASPDGALWIGTNDHGIARYDTASGEVLFYTMEDGLPSDSIRSVCDDGEGNIYVGTSASLARISADGKVTSFTDWTDINYIRSLTSGESGTIAGVTNGGILFFVRGNLLLSTQQCNDPSSAYTAVTAVPGGYYYAGCSDNVVRRVWFDVNRSMVVGEYPTGSLGYFNDLSYDERGGGVFLCAENGMGYLTSDGKVSNLSREDFSSSVSNMICDYQGNLWFVSNKQGIAKLTQSPFLNILSKAGIGSDVVNCLEARNGILYVGTDNGLKAIRMSDDAACLAPGVQETDGSRVRHILADSRGNLWVSTYGDAGLTVIAADGTVSHYTEADGTMGSRFRSAIELSDGRILVASNTGLTYFENGRITDTLSERDGLTTPQILSMVERPDGSILAGSDGDGIYVIRGGAVTGRIGEEEGLESLVVLRIIPFDDGYFYVTSNALYFDNGDYIRMLGRFPYHNNYDIHITAKGEAWISSSAGIYIADARLMEMDMPYTYTLLNRSCGLTTTLTANAWNYSNGADYYICCSDGVRMVNTENYDRLDEDFSITLSHVLADDTQAEELNGVYRIPATTGRIQMQVAVLNYTLSNPRIRLFLEGAGDDGIFCRQNELTALSYTNLPFGPYTLHVQILDETGDAVIREETFSLYKEARIFERTYFKVYLFLVCVLFMSYIAWMISKLGSMTLIHRQYEAIRAAKEEAEDASRAKTRFLANMSHEIRTPISAVMGLDELILRESLNPTARRHAQDIRRASLSLLDIVNDILDLSKIESGKLKLINGRFDLAGMIRDVVTLSRVRCEGKGLDFLVIVDEKIPRYINGDEVRIRQILMNLLSNAAKYTEHGSVELSVQMLEKNDETALVRFRVEDTGIGIRKEDLRKLYEPYERFDEAHHKSVQGTGLGLSITKQLLELMGSSMEVESEYGKGSCFSFELPLRIAGNEQIRSSWKNAEAEQEEELSFTAPDARILIVDDNDMNLYVTAGLLKRTEISVTLADSGAKCLECTAREEFDLILLDHLMPNMDGIETLKKLRERGITTPAIALTANALEGAKEEYLSAGFADYLSKPITGEALEAMILKHLPEDKVQRDAKKTSQKKESAGKKNVAGSAERKSFALTAGDTTDRILELAQRLQLCYDEKDVKGYADALYWLKDAALRDKDAEAIAVAAARAAQAMGEDAPEQIPEGTEALVLECFRLHRQRKGRTREAEAKTEKRTETFREETDRTVERNGDTKPAPGKESTAVQEDTKAERKEKEKEQANGQQAAIAEEDTDMSAGEEKKMGLKENLEEIDIDMAAGMRYCANDEDFYLRVLGKFANGCAQKRAEIEQYYQEKNWAEYAVKAHALKGNARTIGATAFAEKAYEMELAGKASEESKIAEKTPALLEEYTQLAAKIVEVLDRNGKE